MTYPSAEVVTVEEPCEQGARGGADCGALVVTVAEGDDEGAEVRVEAPPQVLTSGLGPGDRVELVRTPPAADQGARAGFSYQATERDGALLWLALVFVVVVVAVARVRGLMAVVGLAVSGLVLWNFTLPALLVGENGLAVAMVTATLLLVVVLYTTHGPSLRTSAALVGTLLGAGLTTAIAGFWSSRASLTGVSDEDTGLLSAYADDLDFRGLLICAFVIAALGVLNDVTITQSSAVWELRAAAPAMPRRELLGSAMRIGRDHIASTIYTIVFAYGGSALAVLDLLSAEPLAEEVVRTLTASVGLVLTVPLTTLVAVLLVGPPRAADVPGQASGA